MTEQACQNKSNLCYVCPDCGYVYQPTLGCEREGYEPGTSWEDIPDNFPCPDCFVREKPDFISQPNLNEVPA